MTSPEPTTSVDPNRPDDPADGALFDAVAAEHGVIYGYGLVSARSDPDLNSLVATSIADHRERREAGIAMLESRSASAPLPAAGYQVPFDLDDSTAAVQLAVRMEEDAAVAWRAVVEQSTSAEDRAFAVAALTRCSVTAARWREVLGVWPVTVAFPGGNE